MLTIYSQSVRWCFLFACLQAIGMEWVSPMTSMFSSGMKHDETTNHVWFEAKCVHHFALSNYHVFEPLFELVQASFCRLFLDQNHFCSHCWCIFQKICGLKMCDSAEFYRSWSLWHCMTFFKAGYSRKQDSKQDPEIFQPSISSLAIHRLFHKFISSLMLISLLFSSIDGSSLLIEACLISDPYRA